MGEDPAGRSVAGALSALGKRGLFVEPTSAIVGAGTPMSRALTEVHLPVPFWPAVSRTMSTNGFFDAGSFCFRMSAVISIRKLPSMPAFHSEKIAPISAGFRPSSRFMRS